MPSLHIGCVCVRQVDALASETTIYVNTSWTTVKLAVYHVTISMGHDVEEWNAAPVETRATRHAHDLQRYLVE